MAITPTNFIATFTVPTIILKAVEITFAPNFIAFAIVLKPNFKILNAPTNMSKDKAVPIEL